MDVPQFVSHQVCDWLSTENIEKRVRRWQRRDAL
jgi:hypothetical protein